MVPHITRENGGVYDESLDLSVAYVANNILKQGKERLASVSRIFADLESSTHSYRIL